MMSVTIGNTSREFGTHIISSQTRHLTVESPESVDEIIMRHLAKALQLRVLIDQNRRQPGSIGSTKRLNCLHRRDTSLLESEHQAPQPPLAGITRPFGPATPRTNSHLTLDNCADNST